MLVYRMGESGRLTRSRTATPVAWIAGVIRAGHPPEEKSGLVQALWPAALPLRRKYRSEIPAAVPREIAVCFIRSLLCPGPGIQRLCSMQSQRMPISQRTEPAKWDF
jgi:hypothetical protein